jgi:segregation and condensation protein B
MSLPPLKQIVEAALVAAGGPLTLDHLLALFSEEERPARADLLAAIAELQTDYAERGLEIVEVAGGYRTQVRPSVAPWVARLWDERPRDIRAPCSRPSRSSPIVSPLPAARSRTSAALLSAPRSSRP